MDVVVVKWSACSPSTPMIRVQIPLKPTVFSVTFVFEKNENKQKEVGVGPFFFKKKMPIAVVLFNSINQTRQLIVA